MMKFGIVENDSIERVYDLLGELIDVLKGVNDDDEPGNEPDEPDEDDEDLMELDDEDAGSANMIVCSVKDHEDDPDEDSVLPKAFIELPEDLDTLAYKVSYEWGDDKYDALCEALSMAYYRGYLDAAWDDGVDEDEVLDEAEDAYDEAFFLGDEDDDG